MQQMRHKRTQSVANSLVNAVMSAKGDAGKAVVCGDWTVMAGYELVENYTIRRIPATDLLASAIDKALALAG